MDKPFQFKTKEHDQLKRFYKAKCKDNTCSFESLEDFVDWYNEQEKRCHYCQLTEQDSQMLVINGTVKSKRFPQNGVNGKGTSRGMWLEIDRYDPNGMYSRTNCVLACYFCNNDKSDVFHGDAYKEFVKDRKGFLTRLIRD